MQRAYKQTKSNRLPKLLNTWYSTYQRRMSRTGCPYVEVGRCQSILPMRPCHDLHHKGARRHEVSGRPRRLWLRRSPEFYTRVSAKRERVFALLTCRSFSVSALLFRGFPTELQRNAELVRVVDAAIPAPLALRPPWRLDRAFVPSHDRVRAPLKTLTKTESQLRLI